MRGSKLAARESCCWTPSGAASQSTTGQLASLAMAQCRRTLPDSAMAMPWDLIVCDESHFLQESQPPVSAKQVLAAARVRSRQRMALTGTPIVNSPADLFAQLEFLMEGLSGFGSEKAFKAFYNKYAYIDDNHSVFLGAQNVPFLQERLARSSFLATQAEVLPDLTEVVLSNRRESKCRYSRESCINRLPPNCRQK